MSFIKCYHRKLKGNQYLINLWTEEKGHEKILWTYPAYKECTEKKATHRGIKGEPLMKVMKWDAEDTKLHFHDMIPYQRFLVDRYGTNDKPSTTAKIMFFDIETEMLNSLSPTYISNAPKKVTSIAWYNKQVDKWGLLILDPKSKLKYSHKGNKEIIPCGTEEELLAKFLEVMREIDPDILVGYNSNYFDIPYLFYRMCKKLGYEFAKHLSPIGYVRETPWANKSGGFVQIVGIESLDYLKLHKKFNWEDEISYTLDYIGKKYANLGKIKYEGNLDDLFRTNPEKFAQYNFRDVEILVRLDENLEYIDLTINISHKGKNNYSEVYASTKVQDGVISAYLLSEKIIPPSREEDPIVKLGYAGGYLFCPKAGIYNYMFDEDLTSQYPLIIVTLNLGKETMVARIIDFDDRNNRLGLCDLKNKDPNEELIIENSDRKQTRLSVKELIEFIEENKWTISANGVMFRTDKESVYSTILKKWFEEREYFKNKMKGAFNRGDKERGKKWHIKQYSFKILMNATYGGLAVSSNRYGSVILAEATTLTGQRVIQESALTANTHINERMKAIA